MTLNHPLTKSDEVEHNKLEGLVKKSELVNGTSKQYRDHKPELLINLLPDSHHSFYTYNGSLTTPPCYEVVTWVIMSEPVHMSQERVSCYVASLDTPTTRALP